MRGGKLSRTFVATRSKEREMTSTSGGAHRAEQAGTDELVCAAPELRTDQRGPRSTFRLNPWVARCVPAAPRPTTLPCHP
jgi:hypothetical protein